MQTGRKRRLRTDTARQPLRPDPALVADELKSSLEIAQRSRDALPVLRGMQHDLKRPRRLAGDGHELAADKLRLGAQRERRPEHLRRSVNALKVHVQLNDHSGTLPDVVARDARVGHARAGAGVEAESAQNLFGALLLLLGDEQIGVVIGAQRPVGIEPRHVARTLQKQTGHAGGGHRTEDFSRHRVDLQAARERGNGAGRGGRACLVHRLRVVECFDYRQMCGICGSTADPKGKEAAAMAAEMVHRGPDDEGVFVDPKHGLSLGARRLAIIDLAGGHQPLANEDQSVWAALNGEIYNHPALLARAKERGHQLSSRVDTEVLVHLWEDYGADLVHALEGMYALAVWDGRRGELLLARDRFGEKPLFYTELGGKLRFASELTALLAALPTTPELDADALEAYFVLGYFPGELTAFEGILQLRPGHLLRWSEAEPQARIERYWSLPARNSTTATHYGALVEEGTHLLKRSIESRMISDVPLGVFLSGGIDSSLTAALAVAATRQRLQTFTVAYDTEIVGEAEPARQVAKALGTEHHEVTLTSFAVGREAPAFLASLDQPNADPAIVALHAVAAVAREHVTVALGGEGADELFGGYPRYAWLGRGAAIEQRVPAPIARAAARGLRGVGIRRSIRLAEVMEPYALAERQVEWVTGGRRKARHRLYGPRLRECAGRDVALADATTLLSQMNGRSVGDRLMRLDCERYLPDDVLAKADRATMAVSLEMRTPFLDRELAEFAASVPIRNHLSHGGKRLLRDIARGLGGGLPASRPKYAFGVPLPEWLQGPLAEPLAHQARDGMLVREGWIDGPALTAAVEEHVSGRRDHSDALWPVLVCGLWLDRLRGEQVA